MRRVLVCVASLLLIQASTAVLVNRTIDDTLGDSTTGALPTYLPEDAWVTGSTCSSCPFYPAGAQHQGDGVAVDATRAYERTWHETTQDPTDFEPNITVSFTGRAVYVFNIINNVFSETSMDTHLRFTLDGATVGYYSHSLDPLAIFEPGLLYNVSVYSNSSLLHGNHTLVISTIAGSTSPVLFDYIVYTTDVDPHPEPAPSTITEAARTAFLSDTSRSLTPSPSTTYGSLCVTTTVLSSVITSPTVDTSAKPGSDQSMKTPLILGIAACGALVVVLLILTSAVLYRSRKRQARRVEPYTKRLSIEGNSNRTDLVRDASTTTPESDAGDATSLSPPPRFPHIGPTSAAATYAGSRVSRPLSDSALELPSAVTSSAAAASQRRHSAHARLFAKIAAAYRPRVAGTPPLPSQPIDDVELAATRSTGSPLPAAQQGGSRHQSHRAPAGGIVQELRLAVDALRDEAVFLQNERMAGHTLLPLDHPAHQSLSSLSHARSM